MADTFRVTTRLDVGPLTRLQRDLPGIADKACQAVALGLEAGMKTRAPVDTGVLRSSIQAVRVGPGHWRVVVGAEYGVFVEYGTRWNRAQPYWNPALREAEAMLSNALADAITRGTR